MKKLVSLLLTLCLVLGCMAFASAEAKTGAAQGFGSEVKVTVTVDDGKITAIDVDAASSNYASYNGVLFDKSQTIPQKLNFLYFT